MIKLIPLTNFLVARRHLLSRKKQTIIAILGVTFGISMYILMSGVMDGVNQWLEDSQFKSTPHIHLYTESSPNRPSVLTEYYSSKSEPFIVVHHQKPKQIQNNIRNAAAIINALDHDPQVSNYSASVTTPVVFKNGATQINGVLYGVDIDKENAMFMLDTKMVAGELKDLHSTHNGIIMGKLLSENLGVRTGDIVTATTPKGQLVQLKVVGVFKTGFGNVDNVKGYTNFSTVQTILQKDHSFITDISVQLRDKDKAKALAPVWQERFQIKAEDWETANETLLTGNKIRNMMRYVVSFTLLIVAGFGIYNIMSMTVNNKLKDIAILKATGFASRDIVRIFLIQAFIIGLLGALLGLGIGFVLSWYISRIPFEGGQFVDLDHFPVSFNPFTYMTGVLFGVLTTFLAAYFPSKKASKTDPVEILRG